ncbi:hypothetical protein [Sphingomonas hylomeconis]|uniref:Uncharacterized protein n=1 Tax=Sphingomonas hylomeconis TaxID=1395958 RepID=A0ABV7STX7_9SPHN|nr:hypothetical protein [Sphingomonas hylomeconis]
MTITFPRALPEAFVGSGPVFELQRVDFLSPETGGRLGALTAGFPLWMASWPMANSIGRVKSDEVTAWVDSMRGAGKRFHGRDVSRPAPRYHLGGVPFTIHPSSWSQTFDADGTAILQLTGCLSGMVISHRDYIGFEWDGWKRSLVRAIEPATATAGGVLQFAIEPPVPPITPSGAVVNLAAPTCLMRLTKDTNVGAMTRRLSVSGGKIAAVEDLVP